MTDKTELEVIQRAREAAADYGERLLFSGLAAEGIRNGQADLNPLIQAFARFERDILATRATDPTPVAWMRRWAFDKNDGARGSRPKGWTLQATSESKILTDDVALYAHPPAVPADGLVEALEALLHQLVEVGGNPRIEANIGKGLDAAFDNATQALAAYRGEA